MATPAAAAQTSRLKIALVPERLGQGTTIEFSIQIAKVGGGVPSPVTRIQLLYPKQVGIVTSGLGLATCTEAVLEILGGDGCPSRSLMGYGTAIAEVEVGGEVVRERATTSIFMAPIAEGSINILFLVNGYSPLLAELVFPGLLLPAYPPYGGDLSIKVPLLESFPEGPDVALVKVRSTIGPLGITYYEHIHGRFIPYSPSGISLPPRCPYQGFPFKATFDFADGTQSTSSERVPCPGGHRQGS
jgi:hypothetical protein